MYRGKFHRREAKRPGREADHLPPCIAEFETGGAIPPSTHMSSLFVVVVIVVVVVLLLLLFLLLALRA
jgi:hypothetical protein